MLTRRDKERIKKNEETLLLKKKLSSDYIPDREEENIQLKQTLNHSKKEINHLNAQLANAFRSIDMLIKRVAELESSRYYRFKKFLSFYTSRLRKNFHPDDDKNIFVVIYNYLFKRGVKVSRALFAKILKHVYLLVEIKKVIIVEVFTEMLANTAEYSQYLYKKKINKSKRKFILSEIKKFKEQPLFSIVIPVYDPPIDFFTEALDSIVNQIYPHWEICIADDCSEDDEVKLLIQEYADKYENIKFTFRTENGHISKATNSAISLAVGEYTVLMDQDDLLREDALYELAKVVNKYKQVDLIYSDEDKIDENGLHSVPHFKPDWSPDSLLSRNYLGHVCAFKTNQLKEIGGCRVGFEGSQDYDLVLRYTEKYNKIIHIPEVLYHWRIHRESAALSETAKPYAYRAAQTALTEAMERRGYEAEFDFLEGFRGYKVRLKIKDPTALVSIIIPTKNKHAYVRKCIDSIVNKSKYKNFEIILIDNNSDDKRFFSLVNQYKKQSKFVFKYVRDEQSFNFARLMNVGRKNAKGEYLVLLNNDTEVITPDWLDAFVEHAQRPEIGVAGCKLLYEDDTIQHVGVIVGLGGVAGHGLIREDRYGPGYFNYVNLFNNYSALTAACIMVRAEVFDKVKGFNEEFVVEYNDVDFCLRVMEAGYRNVYIPHIELYHYESISRGHPHSTPENYKRHVIEVNKFRKKWMKYVEHDPHYNPNLTLGAENFSLKI